MGKESKLVKIYSTDWCYDCKAMLKFFEEKNIAYKVFHVDQDQGAVERLMQLCGGKKIVPTLEIGKKVYVNPSVEFMQTIVSPIKNGLNRI